jgi:hypothetical protein
MEVKDRLFVAVLPAVIICFTVMNLLPSSLGKILVKENGPVEMLSAAGYGAAACWLFWRTWRYRLHDGVTAGMLAALLGMRELDFHTRFTTMGVFKSRYYLSDTVPMGEKLIAFLVVIALLYFAGRYCLRNFRPFWRDLAAGRRYATALAFSLACIVVSKSLDSLSWPIDPIFEYLSNDPVTVLRTIEENLEMAIPVYLLFSIWFHSDSHNIVSDD